MILTTRPAAKGILHCKQGILLVQGNRGGWNLPGGGIDANETAFNAFRRELHEEVGLTESSLVNVRTVQKEASYITPSHGPVQIARWEMFEGELTVSPDTIRAIQGPDGARDAIVVPAVVAQTQFNLNALAYRAIGRALSRGTIN